MSDFEEVDFNILIKDCLNNKNDKKAYNKSFNVFIKHPQIKKMINNLPNYKKLVKYKEYSDIDIKDYYHGALNELLNKLSEKYEINNRIQYNITYLSQLIADILDTRLFKDLPESERFRIKNARNEKSAEYRRKKGMVKSKEYKSRNLISGIDSIYMHSGKEDSTTTIENQIKVEKAEIHQDIAEKEERQRSRQHLYNIGINDERIIDIIISLCFEFDDKAKNLTELIEKLSKLKIYKEKFLIKKLPNIKKALMKCQSEDPKFLGKKISFLLSPSAYAQIINYLIDIVSKENDNENDNKTKIKVKKLHFEKLIMDFSKIRDYLSVLLNEEVKTKQELIEKCSWRKKDSFDKETRRILDLFKNRSANDLIQLKEYLKNNKPNEISKIYDIHTVPNLVLNFTILDIFKKNQQKKMKLSEIIDDILFVKNSKYTQEHITTFRKYSLLPRLNEMKEYGFITSEGNDKYYFSAKFLNDEQISALRKVLPFFIGTYPLSSIGHFLINRLNIEDDKFIIEPFNISNILDDCLTYELLTAITDKKSINIYLKDNNQKIEIKPQMVFSEKETNLLKVLDEKKNEYYLYKIDTKPKDKSKTKNKEQENNNPIFSEIYSIYYKILEHAIKSYKKDNSKNNFSDYVPKGYETFCDFSKTDKELLKVLSDLDNPEVPLTVLELRWLKTIMLDPRFDLFVDENEKQSLSGLVEDVREFDLSAFKVYEYKTKKYQNLVNDELTKKIEKINKEEFLSLLENAKSIIHCLKDYSIKEN